MAKLKPKKCSHLSEITDFKQPQSYECATCIKTGDTWVHLRTCQSCGITLCCDSSPNQHATKHAKTHHHPVIISAEPNERWMWCYEDKIISKY